MRISDMMLQDLPTIWHAPTTDMRLKQHIARILLHEIVVCVYSHAPVVLKTPPMSDHSVPNTVTPRFAEIIKLVEGVCRTHLTEEYAAVIRELTAALARKRPSPLLRGQSRTWACGLTYTAGMRALRRAPECGCRQIAGDHTPLRHPAVGSTPDAAESARREPAGWAVLEEDALHGRILIHHGDESSFVARRAANVGAARPDGRRR